MYLSRFKEHGYTSFHFLAEMTHEVRNYPASKQRGWVGVGGVMFDFPSV